MFIVRFLLHKVGQNFLGGIVTWYGLDSPGIESQWGPDFYPPIQQPGPESQTASCTVGTIPKGKGAGI
jgi:hypothetical protein